MGRDQRSGMTDTITVSRAELEKTREFMSVGIAEFIMLKDWFMLAPNGEGARFLERKMQLEDERRTLAESITKIRR